MQYVSTRTGAAGMDASAAIVAGLAPDGGLFVPDAFPTVDRAQRLAMAALSYEERAVAVLQLFLNDFSEAEIRSCVHAAYGTGFDTPDIAPVVPVGGNRYVMELWHGPTSAFKDMALQLLPHLMVASRRKQQEEGKTLILTATSGDTGKAALEGFRDVDGVEVAVYFPAEGVSDMQRLQMVTQRGDNVHVMAVTGSFDDAQRGVKTLFGDANMAERLRAAGYALSSANSINWGRLAPQIVYYFSAWCDLYVQGRIGPEEAVDFVVPTGNFGNILAAWYARAMGLPVGRLICASNSNHILSDFFATGDYDTRREFLLTASPSMDILVSSNLERLLFEACGRDAAQVRGYMEALAGEGRYAVPQNVLSRMTGHLCGGWASEQQTYAAIASAWTQHGYCLDPHTAVAWQVADERADPNRPTVVVSTASPFKFPADVLRGLTGSAPEGDAFALCRALQAHTGWQQPAALAELERLPIRHRRVCGREDLGGALLQELKLS